MSAWEKALVCGIYTVSPLHVSTGQAEGAIDLPVTKEPHTGFPVIPASSLKGVARASFEAEAEAAADVEDLFGPNIRGTDERNREEMKVTTTAKQDATPKLFTGALVFTEARLVAYAARSLNRPFLYVTCRLILERLGRDLRAAGIKDLGSLALPSAAAEVLVTDGPLARATIVVEDFVYSSGAAESADLVQIADKLAGLLPASEEETRSRFRKGLIVIPDTDFLMLVRRLPVRARIKLDDDTKTTSGEDGNLWYEEQVPADCLFVSMVGARRNKGGALDKFRDSRALLSVSQIGGNETVGEGICLWTVGT